MTPPEVIQAYKEKYAAFPDLVERIVRQFDYDFWRARSSDYRPEIKLRCVFEWEATKEGELFWRSLNALEVSKLLTNNFIDAAYKEFGIVKGMEAVKTSE